MTVDTNPTSGEAPGTDPAPTPDPEPGADAAAEQTPQAPQQDETAARLARLEANLKGREKQIEEERRRAERAEQMIAQYQTNYAQQQMAHQAQPAAVKEPTDDELAEIENQAILEGDKRKLAEIRKFHRDKAKREAMAEFGQTLNQYGQAAQRQQAFTNYMASAGVTDQTMVAEVMKNRDEMLKDPAYAWAAHDAQTIAGLAVERFRRDREAAATKAKEDARDAALESSHTESGKGRNAMPAGKSASSKDKMYFTAAEQKFINYDVTRKGMTRAEAEKRFWASMPENKRRDRIAAGRA